MGQTITVRLTKELAAWLEHVAAKTGVPQGRIIRDQLEKARTSGSRQSFMRLAGSVRGPREPLLPQGLHSLVKAIADTGFLVAFANRNDRHHDWAVRVAERIAAPALTCEAVLAETAFHLQSVSVVLAMLAERYADRHPDLADLCLVRMSDLYPRHSVITVDREDFRIYRRNKREAIPIVSPPER